MTLVSGLMECLCFAGAFTGWTSLVFVLKDEGYYSDLCVNATSANSSVFTDCSAQDSWLSLVYTIGICVNNTLAVPMGLFFDKFGTMAARILVISLYTAGTLMLAFSSADVPILVFPAVLCIILAGLTLMITNIQTSNLFGSHRSTIMALHTGMTCSGSGVFLIVKVLHEKGVSLRSSFLFISACSVIHVLRTFLLLPKTHIPYPLPENYTYGTACCGQSNGTAQEEVGMTPANGNAQEEVGMTPANGNAQEESGKAPANGNAQRAMERETAPYQPWPRPPQSSAVNGPSFRSCVLSWFFLSHLVWFSACRLTCEFLYVSLNSMITHLADGNVVHVNRYTDAFAIVQLCGALCAPWNGRIMDRNKGKQRAPGETEKEADLRSSALSLFITALLSLLFCVCASIPVLPLQYLTFALQVTCISFLYSGNSALISIAFPSYFYGRLHGLITFLCTFVVLLHYPLMIVVTDILQGDPLYVFVGLTFVTLLSFIYPLFIYLHCRRLAAHRCSLNPS
ncbi:equilibrative nucleobase transporter 1-like [Conger conger]|uniref:equilibrative nucleobase transporter 1-like n=1 Tax=Conger conger TaxID=82655 RepID=UPI002A5AADC2|nr:equilibrative nucleobase transporter 1-like [Conger conger]